MECERDLYNTMPAESGSFVLSNSKRFMHTFIREINALKTYNVYYTDMDSSYNDKKIVMY